MFSSLSTLSYKRSVIGWSILNPVPESIAGPPVPGGYKYGNLALQVRGVSDETVKYGYGF
jgi:hypothetical protein